MVSAETDSTYSRVCTRLAEEIVAGELVREDLEAAKLRVCRELDAPKVPKNTDILQHAPDGAREAVRAVVQRKPVRTASGVSPVAIMTAPHLCPHGKCLYCPGGPASEFSSAQSYTGHEPAAARGVQTAYDPYAQVTLRLEQLRHIGHPVDKVELILMGGTMTARSHDYQEWFVKRAIAAMNEYDQSRSPAPDEHASFRQDPEEVEFAYLEDVLAANEEAAVRNIGTTFETKPDWCDDEQIDRMLSLGATKVEVGVQTTYEHINRRMHRGHGVQASIDANRRLRDAGFKVGFHMMPGQPGMTRAMNREDFHQLFASAAYRPDFLKIYPTLVVRDTVVYDMWRRGEYEPLDNEAAATLVAEVMDDIPVYTRLQRVQRDIPADFIDGGVWKSNLRQLAEAVAAERGISPRDIRAREVGHAQVEPDPDTVELRHRRYRAVGGREHFISIEDPVSGLLIGFCRLRFPGHPRRPELEDAAIVRELHVYGAEATFEATETDWQHRGYGRQLMEYAEEVATRAGYGRLAVISGIGARPYYRDQLGYRRDGPYMITDL